jgi:chromosomal replication initiator protein
MPTHRRPEARPRARAAAYQTSHSVHNLWINLWNGRPQRPRCVLGDLRRRRGAPVKGAPERGPGSRGVNIGGNAVEPQHSPDPDLLSVWRKLVDDLPPNQNAWLRSSKPLALHENTAIIAVGDEFTRGRVEGRLRTWLEDALAAAFGRPVRLAVTVDPELPVAPPSEGSATDARRATTADGRSVDESSHRHNDQSTDTFRDKSTNQQFLPEAPVPAPRSTGGVLETRLNPKYVFDTFVIGSSNRFAHAAAVAAAEAPGKAYNPLLIYGDSGLGKTHLLHAIGHYVRSLFNGARVRYVSSEEFTNEFINAIRDDKASTFHRRYRDVDVLLIDDIQFLEGKIQTQEEFFHTFNTLHNASKQIVITSDRPPKRLEALEDRLRNRFEWGLITDVQPPDLETRIAILRKKAAIERLTAPPEVLEFIASKIQTNIRELEGALIRVTAFASLNGQPVDLTLSEIVLKDLIPEGGEPEITAPLIIAQTASYFGLSIDDVCGPSRSRSLVTARQIAMYLCRELTDLSLPKIGQQFGGRDHTTVMYANNRIRGEMAERRSTFNTVTELTNRIKQQARQA